MANATTMDRVKATKRRVAEEFRRHGLDTYVHLVDAKGRVVVRTIFRTKDEFWDIQVKSMKGYGRVIGLDYEAIASSKSYILVVNYNFDDRNEYMYLLQRQTLLHVTKDKDWGDLWVNKPERQFYYEQKGQNLEDLAHRMSMPTFMHFVAHPPLYKGE